MALLVIRPFRRIGCCQYVTRCMSTAAGTNAKPEMADTMSAWQLYQYGDNDVLSISSSVRVPVLHSPNDVLIEVNAASVNPIDVRMRGGYGRVMSNTLRMAMGTLPFLQSQGVTAEFPLTLGRDFSGVVIAAGQNVKKFKPGDEVWGAFSINRQGSHAQYTVACPREITFKPQNLTHMEAGSIPYVALTAWNALSTVGQITAKNAIGKRVLILAGSGGIGNFAIQLLNAWGAEVTTTCSTDAVELCQRLGAHYVIDYTTSNVEHELAKLSGFDLILDTIGVDGPAVSFDLLKSFKNSIYVTVVHPLLQNADQNGFILGNAKSFRWLGCKVIEGFRGGRSYRWGLFVPDSKALGIVTDLVESEKIIPVVEKVYSFDEVPAAYENVEAGHARGKTVIDVKG